MRRKKYYTRRQKRSRLLLILVGIGLLVILAGRTKPGQYLYLEGKAQLLHLLVGEDRIDTGIRLEEAQVHAVIDGDTIDVRSGGKVIRIRLIGVDTPESRHPDASLNTPEGKEAEQYVRSILTEGQTVYLEKDVSDVDRYGRMLCYVWIEKPLVGMSLKEYGERMLNGRLLLEGYARTETVPPDVKYEQLFELMQTTARRAKAGFWKTKLWK